jgi:hypothetical protein
MSKICVHQYLTICKTNPQPPGLADFLRGTRTLYLLSKKYNYKLLIDYDIHPIFKFLRYNEFFFIKNLTVDTIELLPPIEYNEIYNILKSYFELNNNIHILTNSFHSSPMTNDYYDKNEIDESNNYLKEILIPNNLLSILITKRLSKMNINIDDINDKYIVIHLRFHDDCLFNDNFNLNDNHKNNLYNTINDIINNNNDKKIILISNYYKLIEELKQKYNNLFFNKNNPIHLGSLEQNINLNELDEISDIEEDEKDNIEFKLLNKLDKKIRDTLIDLFILTKASKIYSISQYGGTGFSNEISQIYNIPYDNLSHHVF